MARHLYDATRLGEVDGLCGANCRHSYYGYYEGSPRTWSKEELENIDPEPFEYNGKEYTFYEATQRMRYMERQIRKTKREAVGFEAAVLDEDFTAASIKLNRQKQEYQKFARASGVRPRLGRTQEFGYNHSVSSRAAWKNRKAEKNVDLSDVKPKDKLKNARMKTGEMEPSEYALAKDMQELVQVIKHGKVGYTHVPAKQRAMRTCTMLHD